MHKQLNPKIDAFTIFMKCLTNKYTLWYSSACRIWPAVAEASAGIFVFVAHFHKLAIDLWSPLFV